MVETYARPRFGEPREPVNRVNPGSRLKRVIDFVTASQLRSIAFLTLCGLLLFLPGFFNISPIDRDEARFAQATKQMVETGDFVDIRFQDDVRYKKPVGIYWLQSAAVETASALGLPRAELRIWIYRIPSLIGAIGSVVVAWLGIHLLSGVNPATLPVPRGAGLGAVTFSSIALDWTALGFTFALALLVGVFFGLYPANRAASMRPIDALRYE